MLSAGQVRFAQKVGVAPGTSTLFIPASDMVPGGKYVPPTMLGNGQIRRPPTGRKLRTRTTLVGAGRVPYNPYASEVEMRGLGVVNPTDHWRTGSETGRMAATSEIRLRIRDGRYYPTIPTSGVYPGLGLTNGEINRSLSGLGTVPNDDDLASIWHYTPVNSGWIFGNKPAGQKFYVDGFYGSDDTATLVEQLRLQRRQTMLQAVTTVAIASLAGIGIWNHFKGRKSRTLGGARRRRHR